MYLLLSSDFSMIFVSGRTSAEAVSGHIRRSWPVLTFQTAVFSNAPTSWLGMCSWQCQGVVHCSTPWHWAILERPLGHSPSLCQYQTNFHLCTVTASVGSGWADEFFSQDKVIMNYAGNHFAVCNVQYPEESAVRTSPDSFEASGKQLEA